MCEKKTGKKNTKYLRNKTNLKDRPSSQGYSPCKILTLGDKSKFKKTCQNPFYKSFTVVQCKKPLKKTPNIREMRPF